MDHQYVRRKHAEEAPLPDNDDDTVLVGCKKAGNINRFYDRTAGLFAVTVVRPSHCQLYRNVYMRIGHSSLHFPIHYVW